MANFNNTPDPPNLFGRGGFTPAAPSVQYRYPDSLGTPPFEKWILFQVKPSDHINRDSGNFAAANPDFTIASVALYLPPEALSSTLTANYDSSGGLLTGAALDTIAQAQSAYSALAKGTQTAKEGIKSLREPLGKLLTAGLITAGQTIAEDLGMSPQVQNRLLGATTSQTINTRVDLFYKNTEYRQHDMQFTLIPRNKAEADTIDNILNVFNEAMLADYGGNFLEADTPAFIGYPYEFEIMMFTQIDNNKNHINTIDRSVLKSVSINHASGTRVAFVDSRGEAEYYPASTTLRLSFQETRIQGRHNKKGWWRGRGGVASVASVTTSEEFRLAP